MSTRVWHRMVIAVLSLGFASLPVKAQSVGPLANTTVGNARLIVPDGSSVRQSISSGETRWFVFGAEPGKTYVVEAVDPDSDLVSNTIGALHVYAADGTTTPPAETNVDCTASTRAPAMELPVAVSGMRCVVRAFPPTQGNTQNKRGLYVAVGSVTGPSFQIRVRESTIYGRWTTNGYDFHVELQNTSADSMCAQVMLLPNSGNTYAGTWSGAVTTQQLTIPAFGANKLVFANGTLVGSDLRGTLRIGACNSPVNLMPSGLHVSTFAFNSGISQYLYFFTTPANNGAASNSWSAASGTGSVTSIATGQGLTGGPITTTGTINLAATNLLPTIACAVNQIPKWNGTAWTCAADDNSGGTLTGGGASDYLTKWTGGTTLGNSAIYETGGHVGIGTTAPVNRLQIGTAPSFSGNDLAIGNGTYGMSFVLSNGAYTWFSSTNFALMPNTGSGLVGIGTQSPANKLHIGSVGSSGYSGYDIAFGNGTQASAIAQNASVAPWYSNTNIALMPQGGSGRVGINTTTPFAPLEVDGYTSIGGVDVYFNVTSGNLQSGLITSHPSIFADQSVLAYEFDAASDERIKDIVGLSDSVEDLATVNALQVTDYTLKDKAVHGDQRYKKVIGQQVEKVYPQVVSKGVDYIPNVYQAASTVTPTERGLVLHFDQPHHLSAQAKRIKLLASGEHTMQRVAIVAIPSARDVVIDKTRLNGDKVFVYGEEVNDFRTVDYEGLAALNISATQELSKRLTRQEAESDATIAEQQREIAELRERVDVMESLRGELAALRAELADLREARTQITGRAPAADGFRADATR